MSGQHKIRHVGTPKSGGSSDNDDSVGGQKTVKKVKTKNVIDNIDSLLQQSEHEKAKKNQCGGCWDE